MSKILLDGESVYEASRVIGKLQNGNFVNINQYDSLMNVIYGIVLWDEVYVVEEALNSHFLSGVKFFKQYVDCFNILYNRVSSWDKEQLLIEDFYKYKKSKSEVENSETNDISKDLEILFGKEGYYTISLDERRALDYWLISNENGLDYMPSIQRLSILQSYDFLNFFNRIDVMNNLEGNLNEFYKGLNALIGKDVIRYKFPVLLDYILDRYKSLEDIVKCAFELKNDSNVVKFRREMDDLDVAFSQGNLKEIKKYFETIKEIIENISKTKNIKRHIDVTVSIPPALSIEIGLPNRRPNQCLFIKDLTYYGVNKRKPSIL